jgi:hypothetical protein
MALEYERQTRTSKRNKTWRQVAVYSRYQRFEQRDSEMLTEAPIDEWVIAEVRRIAMVAPVTGMDLPS